MKKKKKNIIKDNTFILPFIKVLVSVFIMYHLLMVFFTPPRHSVVYDFFKPYFHSYAHSLSMDNYHMPYMLDPLGDHDNDNSFLSHYSFYFQYKVIKTTPPKKRRKTKRRKRSVKKNFAEVYRWPPTRKESRRVFFNHNRLMVHSQFFINMVVRERSIRRYFLPYLCRLHPLAKRISLKVVLEKQERVYKPRRLIRRRYKKSPVLMVSSRCWRGKTERVLSSVGLSNEVGLEDSQLIKSHQLIESHLIEGTMIKTKETDSETYIESDLENEL